jgi:hypothetical protein
LVNGRTVVTYALFASGLPQGQHWVLWVWSLGGEPRPAADAYINDEGKLVNVLADPQHQVVEDPVDLDLLGAAGEPFKLALISDDGSLHVFTMIVPFPIETTAGPCRLSAIQSAIHYASVAITVTGLKADEDLIIDRRSGGEDARSKAKANDQGNFLAAVMPFAAGRSSGQFQFSIESKSCNIGVQFPWGEGSDQPQ